MSKKTFAAAPKPRQPTPEQIAAYEEGGTGHDRQIATGPHQKTSSKPVKAQEQVTVSTGSDERTKRLSLDLPASVHTRFKTACSATGRKMVSEINEFIERRTTELEAEAGISRK